MISHFGCFQLYFENHFYHHYYNCCHSYCNSFTVVINVLNVSAADIISSFDSCDNHKSKKVSESGVYGTCSLCV